MTLQEQEETTELRHNRELKVELCWSIFGQFLAACCQGVPHSVSLQAGLQRQKEGDSEPLRKISCVCLSSIPARVSALCLTKQAQSISLEYM